LRVLILTQGRYGERIHQNLIRREGDWIIKRVELPRHLPPLIEEPETILKGLDLSKGWDLLIYLGESPSAATLIPGVVELTGVEAVIAPVDRYPWLPLGLENQLRAELDEMGVEAVFPRPFCSLTPRGFDIVDRFAERFGMPRLRIDVEDDVIRDVEVLRGAPCGSTWFMAERLIGVGVEEAAERAGLLVQIYPCLASRDGEPPFDDAPIHISARLAMKAVERALKTL